MSAAPSAPSATPPGTAGSSQGVAAEATYQPVDPSDSFLHSDSPGLPGIVTHVSSASGAVLESVQEGAESQEAMSPRYSDPAASAAEQIPEDATGDLGDLMAPEELTGEVTGAGEQAGEPSRILLDRRYERQRYGLLKFEPEKGMPEVGGPGWRTKWGHMLKNQTYYSQVPKQNLWDNPVHAGLKTWQAYHGHRMRGDAALMEKLDKLDVEQEQWEAKKAFVNTSRLETLDRFYGKKVENEQREFASGWAPHPKTKREIHRKFDTVTAELNGMPLKELKKVLTPCTMHLDREAVRMITQRVQTEETWKESWKQMEKQRHDVIRSDFEQRMYFNQVLMDLSSQPRPHDPNHRIKNVCSPRLEELCKPHEAPPPGGSTGDVTNLSDFRGLVHVDNAVALEARLPGQGYEMAMSFRQQNASKAQAGWPPPKSAESPALHKTPRTARLQATGEETLHSRVEKRSIPIAKARLQAALRREAAEETASNQYKSTEAPPPPDHEKLMLSETLAASPRQMASDLSARTNHLPRPNPSASSMTQTQQGSGGSAIDLAPPKRQYYYPVLAPTIQAVAGPARRGAAAGISPSSARRSTDPRRRRAAERQLAMEAANACSGPYSARGQLILSADVLERGGKTPAQAAVQAAIESRKPTTNTVCAELDDFEATKLCTVPNTGNFYLTPRWTKETIRTVLPDSDDDMQPPVTQSISLDLHPQRFRKATASTPSQPPQPEEAVDEAAVKEAASMA
eukprot:TRINITY_DN2134_c0_g1_i1.p1 TRINITY_DN2134_c0_g1~~TRINITY_DN2134_c0_g1_i1.p1  ORF type:complete len:740 (+),score=199.50 TRINITY_DN2134_c0_g1_i1:126-2345(+)